MATATALGRTTDPPPSTAPELRASSWAGEGERARHSMPLGPWQGNFLGLWVRRVYDGYSPDPEGSGRLTTRMSLTRGQDRRGQGPVGSPGCPGCALLGLEVQKDLMALAGLA